VDGVTPQYCDTLQEAYDKAPPTGGVIKARKFTFVEALILDKGKHVTIKGGYAPNYVDRPGGYYTLLQGKLTVGTGSLVTEQLVVR
jgi:hypothetical protein